MAGYSSRSPGDDFIEGGVTVDGVVSDAAVIFPSLQGWISGGQDSDGWIDVRGLDNLVVLATAAGQGATITVKSRRTTVDPVNNDLAVATGVTAGSTVAIFDNSIGRISHIRILQRYTTTPGGTITISFLGE